MKILLTLLVAALAVGTPDPAYVPTQENLDARAAFEANRFGIFLHWGLYSMYGQGEWYLKKGNLDKEVYSQAAGGFYPSRYDARAWVKAFKDAGARYVCFTSRHHDGFSMFKTDQSGYNIVDATPFGRDVMRELIDACHEAGLKVHLYYSLLDWWRNDYPPGSRSVRNHPAEEADYGKYFNFMKGQMREILTRYGKIDAIWLDGYWDHRRDPEPFDWRIREFYDYIHSFDSSVLIGNNHHIGALEGEDFQMFERDLPGENTAGHSAGVPISAKLPLEMCQTMNRSWGYAVADEDYKPVADLVRLIVRCVAKNSNLLLNIGPQADGALPAPALERLRGIGAWMAVNGESVYGNKPSGLEPEEWGVSTKSGKNLYLHLFTQPKESVFSLPLAKKQIIASVSVLGGGDIPFSVRKGVLSFNYPEIPEGNVDTVIRITCK